MPFTSLGLTPRTTAPLAALGFTTPTAVQAALIPLALAGKDVVARAQTGTGKTAAFGLPLVQRMAQTDRPSHGRPRALVLTPTRELAHQVRDALRAFSGGNGYGPRVVALVGGEAIGPQIRDLKRGADVLVATPGRLIDHLDRRTADLSAVALVTLDEADRMLDMGFLPPLTRIMATVPDTRQTLLVSATLAPTVMKVARQFTREPARIDIAPESVVAATVVHRVYAVAPDDKRAVLGHLLTSPERRQALVFCRTKHGSDRVGRYLQSVGVPVAVIHGDKTQSARTRALADFKAGRAQALVATDVAARGLDIDRLPLVVNFDLPLVASDYVHRIGRTGRAGRDGEAISLATSAERSLLRDIQKLLSAPIERATLEAFVPPAVVATPPVVHAERTPGARRPHGHGGPGPRGRGRTFGRRSAGPRPDQHRARWS